MSENFLTLNRVAGLTLFFWIVKILSTTVGETAADFVAVDVNIGLVGTTILMGIITIAAIFWNFKQKKYFAPAYWFLIVMMSIEGTLITDILVDNFNISLISLDIVFTIMMALGFLLWYKIEGTLSIHKITNNQREVFLNQRGLELSKEKTHITHIRDGFNFLGFNFRKYPNNKVIVKPTKDGIKSFKSKIKEIFKKYNSSSLSMLITKLNPLLRGWANYYRFVNSKVVFDKIDTYIWRKSLNWMKRIHQRKETIKYYKQYFKPFPNYKSDVLSDGKQFVYRLGTLPLKEFIKIKSEANPYDKSFDEYFIKRYFALKNLTKV